MGAAALKRALALAPAKCVRTRQVWQPRFGRDLSRDEAKQIATSVNGFLAVLAEWSRANMPDPANGNGGAATSDDEGVRDDR